MKMSQDPATTPLTDEQIDKVVDRFVERLETDPAFQAKLLGLVMKGISGGGIGGIMKMFGGGKP